MFIGASASRRLGAAPSRRLAVSLGVVLVITMLLCHRRLINLVINTSQLQRRVRLTLHTITLRRRHVTSITGVSVGSTDAPGSVLQALQLTRVLRSMHRRMQMRRRRRRRRTRRRDRNVRLPHITIGRRAHPTRTSGRISRSLRQRRATGIRVNVNITIRIRIRITGRRKSCGLGRRGTNNCRHN